MKGEFKKLMSSVTLDSISIIIMYDTSSSLGLLLSVHTFWKQQYCKIIVWNIEERRLHFNLPLPQFLELSSV